jgi:hypothetical protein
LNAPIVAASVDLAVKIILSLKGGEVTAGVQRALFARRRLGLGAVIAGEEQRENEEGKQALHGNPPFSGMTMRIIFPSPAPSCPGVPYLQLVLFQEIVKFGNPLPFQPFGKQPMENFPGLHPRFSGDHTDFSMKISQH